MCCLSVGVVLGFFTNGEGIGLLGNSLLGAYGLRMFCLSFIYSFILFLRDGKSLTYIPHGLHVDTWVL